MTDNATGKKTAGAFDVRVIIGALLGIYAVILVFMGLFADTEEGKTGDVNANLWAGLALAVVSAGFLIWWRVRPIVVPDDIDKDMERPDTGH